MWSACLSHRAERSGATEARIRAGCNRGHPPSCVVLASLPDATGMSVSAPDSPGPLTGPYARIPSAVWPHTGGLPGAAPGLSGVARRTLRTNLRFIGGVPCRNCTRRMCRCPGSGARRPTVRRSFTTGTSAAWRTQLGALGLVLNCVVLWTTVYLDATVRQLRAQGYPVREDDMARLSPFVSSHLGARPVLLPAPRPARGAAPAA
jgi:Tn3 transposase DDE domain